MELLIENLGKRYGQHWALVFGGGSGPSGNEAAVVIDPSLEDAYLLATGRPEVRV